MKKLLIATGNKGKFKEFCNYLNSADLKCMSISGYSLIEPEENGTSFTENAYIKAKYYNQHTNLPALADDSGLAIDQLGGSPGIFSARWAGPNKDFKYAINKIANKLTKEKINFDSVTGSFICALCYYQDNNNIVKVSGSVKGKIIIPARGNNGFGYDPIFIPDGQSLTFAEMNDNQKAKYSHRIQALTKIREYL